MLQLGVAAAMVLELLPPALRAAHLLVGTLIWGALVILAFHSRRTPPLSCSQESTSQERKRHAEPSVLADLVTLTKPRIISLLLVTTVAPMFITPAGLPSVSLVLWVILGGYLMAGGANAINMWFDRDIDDKMSRTRLRPIPAGRIPATLGLAFGIALGLMAFAIFWYRVNPLSAWLALGGLLFYVFIYTIWLKRSSPAEHRHWRGGRGLPAAGGLGRDDRAPRPGSHLPVCHHLLLDAAALLGPGSDQAGRICQGRRADDAGGARRSSEPSSRCWPTR